LNKLYHFLDQAFLGGFFNNNDGIDNLEDNKRNKNQNTIASVYIDHDIRSDSLKNALPEMKTAYPDMAVAQLIEKLVQVSPVCFQNVFASSQPANEGK